MSAVEPLSSGKAAARIGITYEHADADCIAAQTGVLAAIDFGIHPANRDDARRITVPLPVIGNAAATEVWRVDGEVRHGHDGDLAWSEGGGYLMLSLRVDESAHGDDPAAAAEYGYQRLLAAMAEHDHRHWLRAWNYLADINDGDGDNERYRHFSRGRARGLGQLPATSYPAATAIGHNDPASGLVVYTLSARQPGRPLENPRQVSAWRYPRQYGPVPPSFARAMLLDERSGRLLISGTASVVGHDTLHDSAGRQLHETLRNLETLLATAGFRDSLAASSHWLKLYLRHAHDRDVLLPLLDAAGIARDRLLYLHGDICRRDLLVEIDGIAVDHARN